MANQKTIEDFMKRVQITNTCWLWIGSKNRGGYGQWQTKNQYYLAHRAAYELFIGGIPEGMCVCHSCDIRHCVNPEHLWLGTNKDNVNDRDQKGRGKIPDNHGENHGMAKLTEKQVKEIRQLAQGNWLQREIASKFGIDQRTVSLIINNKIWKS